MTRRRRASKRGSASPARLRAACLDTGFFYLANHGISQAEFDVAHAWGLVFFELPRAEKTKLDKNNHPARQGWMPVGGMNPGANPDKDADQKETFVLPRDCCRASRGARIRPWARAIGPIRR